MVGGNIQTVTSNSIPAKMIQVPVNGMISQSYLERYVKPTQIGSSSKEDFKGTHGSVWICKTSSRDTFWKEMIYWATIILPYFCLSIGAIQWINDSMFSGTWCQSLLGPLGFLNDAVELGEKALHLVTFGVLSFPSGGICGVFSLIMQLCLLTAWIVFSYFSFMTLVQLWSAERDLAVGTGFWLGRKLKSIPSTFKYVVSQTKKKVQNKQKQKPVVKVQPVTVSHVTSKIDDMPGWQDSRYNIQPMYDFT
jgi:hypothetical protein